MEINTVKDLIEYMPFTAVVVEIFSGDSTVPFYNDNQYRIPKNYCSFSVVKFSVCFENNRIVYKIYVGD